MIKTAQKRIDYIKELDIPIYFVCDGSAPSLLATQILDEYLGYEKYMLYASYLPCHPKFLKETLSEYLKERKELGGDHKVINCGNSCTPLNKDRKPTKYNEQCYYGACQKIPMAITKEFGYMHCINIISGVYDYSQIKHCEQFRHFIPDKYGLIKPFKGSENRSKGYIYSLYLFMGYTQKEIMEEAEKYDFRLPPAICWDELDKIMVSEVCRDAKTPLTPQQKAEIHETFRNHRIKFFADLVAKEDLNTETYQPVQNIEIQQKQIAPVMQESSDEV
jgi:hypothetical protein